MNGMSNMGQGPPPLHSLIKPEQVVKLTDFPEEQRAKYFQGITKLWESINTRPADSPEYQAAYKKLIEVSYNVKSRMDQRKEQAASAAVAAVTQNGARPPNPPVTQDQRPQSQGGPPQPPQEQYSQKTLERVEQANLQAPPHLIAQNGPEAGQVWVKNLKEKYAQMMQRFEQAENSLKKVKMMTQQRNSMGNPLNAEEAEQVKNQIAKMQNARDMALTWLKQCSQQQNEIKSQMGNQRGSSDSDPNLNRTQPSSAPTSVTVAAAAQSQGPASNMSSTQETVKQEGPGPGRSSAMSPPTQAQAPSQVPPSQQQQPINIPPTTLPPAASNAQPPPSNVKTEPPPPEHKFNPPVPSIPVHPPHLGEPQPLKHEDALEKARTYSQPGYPQHPPQGAPHGHPPQHNQREGQPNSHSKMPVPKELNLPPPQAVSMGQARPTMTNGPMNMGPIGQPSIHRTPGYVLEGDGERVLSKKKLEELVKQVTGGSGAEGEEGETIAADVEETLLNVADEFVDQVIVSACRLAKLRQSSTLELRDIQLILERNYNIRVPGYASDELRTVKKIQPAPAWTQKLSAVQAAKVTGGKGDL